MAVLLFSMAACRRQAAYLFGIGLDAFLLRLDIFCSFAQKGCWIPLCFTNISQACYGHLWTPLATTDQRKFSTLAVSPKMAARSNRLAALLLQRVRPARLLTCTRICRSTISSGAETHGGDDIHKVDRLVCDFSVTTNALGPVPKALEAVQQLLAGQENLEALKDWNPSQSVTSAPAVEHYPQRSDLQLEEVVATFLRGNDGKSQAQQQLIFGNGASELIDLLARAAPSGKYCLNPATEVQYREYQRACTNAGRERTDKPQEASIICLVNPNNPTGDFLEREEMESWITANAAPGSWVLVDESMLFWAGPDFQERGVSSKFVESMVKKHINIFLVQSWTKIFACTGLRIGTVLCPTQEKRDHLLSLQVPWSVTIFARAYLKAAIWIGVIWKEHGKKLQPGGHTWWHVCRGCIQHGNFLESHGFHGFGLIPDVQKWLRMYTEQPWIVVALFAMQLRAMIDQVLWDWQYAGHMIFLFCIKHSFDGRTMQRWCKLHLVLLLMWILMSSMVSVWSTLMTYILMRKSWPIERTNWKTMFGTYQWRFCLQSSLIPATWMCLFGWFFTLYHGIHHIKPAF